MKKALNNWGMVVTGVFLLITLTYILIVGDGINLQVHDNLDSNIAYYKMLKENGLYWTFRTETPLLGGLDRIYLFSNLKVYTWLYMIFPPLVALIIGWYMKIAISIAGFYILGKTIYENDKNKNIFIVCGLIYGICPTFPTSPFGFATMPLLMTILILLYRKFEWKYMLMLLAYPLLSDFSLFGIFICGFLLLFFVIDWIVEKKPRWRFILAILFISAGYVITEWRLFYTMLISKQESIRASFTTGHLNALAAFKVSASAFVKGIYHSASSHALIILPICFLYFAWLNYRYVKKKNIKGIFSDPFNWLMVWQGFNSLFVGLNKMVGFHELMETVIPFLRGFNFERTLWFSPFIWYFSFMIILCRVSWKTITKVVLCCLAFVVVCLYPNRYNHIYLNGVATVSNITGSEWFEQQSEYKKNELSYGEFYSPELFDEIKEDIGYNGEWSIAYGMHPSVIVYNGIASLDGFWAVYPMDYKEQFRKLIEPEFEVDPRRGQGYDEYGARAYIFSKDVSYLPYRTSDVTKADLFIDPDVFREMGGKYVFSRVKITNADDLAIREIGVYENEKSPYTIYVYEAE